MKFSGFPFCIGITGPLEPRALYICTLWTYNESFDTRQVNEFRSNQWPVILEKKIPHFNKLTFNFMQHNGVQF